VKEKRMNQILHEANFPPCSLVLPFLPAPAGRLVYLLLLLPATGVFASTNFFAPSSEINPILFNPTAISFTSNPNPNK
jgi:hypothetical protein